MNTIKEKHTPSDEECNKHRITGYKLKKYGIIYKENTVGGFYAYFADVLF